MRRPFFTHSSGRRPSNLLRLKGKGTDNHFIADAADRRATLQQPEINVDALLAGRRNVAAGVRPCVDDIAGRRNVRPAIPGAKGYVVRPPFHLRGELGGGRLDVPDDIAWYGIRLYDELGVIRIRDEPARPAVLVV